jgi:SIR2-like domain
MGQGIGADSDGRPASLRQDTVERYHKTKAPELEKGFFRRDSTWAYIQALASLDDVTIYAGAGVSADVGAPLSDELMPYILGRWIMEHPDLRSVSDATRHADIGNRVTSAIAKAYPPAYIGSIAREMARQREAARHRRINEGPEASRKFSLQIDEANDAGYTTGGFLARSVGALAFALKREGRCVEIITTNYDNTIVNERPKIVDYFTDLTSDCDYFFDVRTSVSDEQEPGDDAIPVFHINGAASDGTADPLVIGEADFFAWYDENLEKHHRENQQWRQDRLDAALTKTACLFVGSSLTDPDVLAKLAETKYQQPRYAVLLAPDQENEPDGSALLELGEGDPPRVDSDERCLARDAVAQRFLHLGVIPIMVDFPHQVPQLLIEIALKIQQGDDYQKYSDRLDKWWSRWAGLFGFEDELTPGPHNVRLQGFWAHELASIRGRVREAFGLEPSADEKIVVEAWVRNPRERTLFQWATSEGIWLNGDTAPSCDLGESDIRFGVQRSFRKGRTHVAETRPKQGHWRYEVSVPLTLHVAPWHHLPVGVICVRSSKANGELWKAADRFEDLEMLEDLLLGPTNDLLNPEELKPEDPRWYEEYEPAGPPSRP